SRDRLAGRYVAAGPSKVPGRPREVLLRGLAGVTGAAGCPGGLRIVGRAGEPGSRRTGMASHPGVEAGLEIGHCGLESGVPVEEAVLDPVVTPDAVGIGIEQLLQAI